MTDHHLDDNADDQVRDAMHHASPAATQALYGNTLATGPEVPQTPVHIRGRHPGTSALAGSIATCDLAPGTPLTDLVGPDPDPSDDAYPSDQRTQVVRIVGERILVGERMEVREDGRVYPVDEDAADLAEQLVDVAGQAAATDPEEPGWAITDPYDFAEAIAGMASAHLQRAGLALEVVEACSGCGCTTRRGCVTSTPIQPLSAAFGQPMVETCHWISTPPGAPARCSKCGPEPKVYDAHPATIMGIRIHLDDDIPEGEVELRDRSTGEVVHRIVNIGNPSDADADKALQLLVPGEEHPIPYAATTTVTTPRRPR